MDERAEFTISDELTEAAIQLLGESDRGCVLVAAALVDDLLTELLRANFRKDEPKVVDKLFTGQLPILGSTWTKNILAHSLSLYSDRRLFEQSTYFAMFAIHSLFSKGQDNRPHGQSG